MSIASIMYFYPKPTYVLGITGSHSGLPFGCVASYLYDRELFTGLPSFSFLTATWNKG